MHNTLARLKKAGSQALAQGQGSGSGGSHATGSGPATAAASTTQQHGEAAAPAPAYAPMSMSEKTLPPGAAGYVHPNNRWDNARSERDEIERALRLSQEEEEYRDAIKASQDAEEAALIERNRQLQLEEEALRASRAEHEAHEDQLAIAQAEEEHAILEALRASEREHERISQGRHRRRSSANAPVSKGKQRGSTGESRDVDPTGTIASTSTPGPDGEESDEEVKRAMQLSLADQEEERREQEEILAEVKRKRLSLTSTSGPSTSAAANVQNSSSPSSRRLPTSPRPVSTTSASSSASHLESPSSPSSISTMTFGDRPTRPPPPPPQSQPQNHNQIQQAKSPQQQRPPQLPQRRRLPEAEDYESMVDAPPPAYEPSPGGPSAGANSTSAASPSGRTASAQSQSLYSTATEGASAHTPMGSVGMASPTATDASSVARQQAEALEEKRQIFYPPVASNEMAEGTMRAFVPHMLFAARARNRSDPDEYLPMVSRELDMQDLPTPPPSPPSSSLPSSPQALTNSTGTNGTRPRRPLPPLPPGGPPQPNSGTPGPPMSALQQLDQKIAATSSDSPSQPTGYYRASDHIGLSSQAASTLSGQDGTDRRASQVESVSSTAAAVEDEDQQDPFDDSQAASPVSGSDDDSSDGHRQSAADDDETGSDTADEEYYNDHPSATIRSSKHPFSAIKGDTSSSTHNNLSHAPSFASEDSVGEQEDTMPEPTLSPERVVERHDYARASPQQVDSDGRAHLPPAVSPEPQSERDAIASQQRGLAAGGTAGYASDESAMSWESTGSEDESGQAREPLNESAKDINTNISFGFNPLSSPNQYLDWQGRFPDLIVLSRFSDTPAGDREQSASANTKEDYRTFAFEAPTWRELIAYLMWHGNSIFEASSKDKESSAPNSLRVSLILEFVKTVAPPSTMVRLQIHLLNAGAATPGSAGDAGDTGGNASRGVALSRSPLSSRPTSYVRSNLPWQQDSSKGSTHLVLALPKPYHSLPFNLGTIGSHLHNAHRAAVVQHNQQASDNRIRLSDKSRISNTQFLADLLRGIDICTDTSEKADAASNSKHGSLHGRKHSSGSQHAEQDHESPDDSRFNKLVGRMRQKRHDMRGTFREMHKRSQTRRRERQLAKGKGKGKGTAKRNSSDSDQSHLESQPKAEDYHITPFPNRA